MPFGMARVRQTARLRATRAYSRPAEDFAASAYIEDPGINRGAGRSCLSMSDPRQKFEALALPHLDAAYNLARWLCRSPTDAEDVVQDAMLRAYRNFEQLRGGDVRPWLMAIVRNGCRTQASRPHRRREVPLPDGASGPELVFEGPDPETQAVRASEARRLRTTIASLPDDFREVLILREMEDLSYREIADVVGAPIGTIMSRLARARALLKAAWLAEAQIAGDRHGLR
jgi:RNA polymerase sigma-70 factor (ECF subfamily)